MARRSPSRKPTLVRRFFSVLGPGLITGAADDDPSGIATYSIAGAQLGTSMLWAALITWPFMAAVQFMCARIGLVTGMSHGRGIMPHGKILLPLSAPPSVLISSSGRLHKKSKRRKRTDVAC